MKITFQHSIVGYLVGTIWMPALECYKPLRYDLTREDARYSDSDGTRRVGSLRDHILRAINDGDFQSCAIADGVLRTIITVKRGGLVYRRTRYTDLSAFPGIADYLKDDWAGPEGDE